MAGNTTAMSTTGTVATIALLKISHTGSAPSTRWILEYTKEDGPTIGLMLTVFVSMIGAIELGGLMPKVCRLHWIRGFGRRSARRRQLPAQNLLTGCQAAVLCDHDWKGEGTGAYYLGVL